MHLEKCRFAVGGGDGASKWAAAGLQYQHDRVLGD